MVSVSQADEVQIKARYGIKKLPGAHALLTIPLGWRGAFYSLKVNGGPYDKFPDTPGAFGVCVRKEKTTVRYDMRVNIVDFQVPTDVEEMNGALLGTVLAALNGRDVYVGCMGGWGRTGLFLAVLAKAAGKPDPVQFVRDNYTSHAVETDEQQDYVAGFDVYRLQNVIFWETWGRRVRSVFGG